MFSSIVPVTVKYIFSKSLHEYKKYKSGSKIQFFPGIKSPKCVLIDCYEILDMKMEIKIFIFYALH